MKKYKFTQLGGDSYEGPWNNPPPTGEFVKAEEVRELLEEIAKGDGAYNPDRTKHAENCIDNMKSTAKEALLNLL